MSRLFSKNITIPSSCIFYETSKSFAFVNLKPVLPGHVLVSPIRVAPLFEDLTQEEVSDLFQTAQKVEKAVKLAFHGHGSHFCKLFREFFAQKRADNMTWP